MVKDKVEETGVNKMVHKFYSADLHGFVHRFLQDLVNEMTEISAEDKLFLTIIEHKEKKVINGHCQFPLPLRNLDITIPNNKSMAEKNLVFEMEIGQRHQIL